MRRIVRVSVIVAMVAVIAWLAFRESRKHRVRSLASECQIFERSENWERLIRSAREWMRLEPESREARRSGATAGRALHDPLAVNEFLEAFPRQLPEDAPSLSMLADLEFGPLNKPHQGAQVCRDILQIIPNHQESHQRLIFYYAMTQQHIAMQTQIGEAINNNCEMPEAYVYSFLGQGLRLRNGAPIVERWLSDDRDSEQLLVAHALHIAQSLAGAIPSIDENTAAEMRRLQRVRESALADLLTRFPDNTELLAFHLQAANQNGAAAEAGELLSKAPPAADNDYRFWHARGWIFSRLYEYDEAEGSYRRGLKLHTLDWRIRFHLAELLRATGRLEEADKMNQIAVFGRGLERELLARPDMRSVPSEIYERLADYARQCEADVMARHMFEFLSGSFHK
ncbi:MAG: hypothetical protein WKF77_27445 [Planctomycetaceae bacterium]